jgi:hypothetical protein
MGGITGYYTATGFSSYTIRLKNAVNAGRVEIEKLAPDMKSYCDGIIGSVNFKKLRRGGTVIENCYSLDSVASQGIGNDYRWRVWRVAKQITLLGIDAMGEQDNFDGLDFENIWIMSKDEPLMPVLRIFEKSK